LGPALRHELNLVGRKDKIFENSGPKPFEFNEEVVQVFDDMVSRSVPLYFEVTDLLLYWLQKYYIEGACIIDLGCSTGTTLEVIARSFDSIFEKNSNYKQDTVLHLVGIDNSKAMVKTCLKKLEWIKLEWKNRMEN